MLGLDGLDDAVRPVPVETLPGARGHLDAAMLDTRASYDALIHRIASDPEHRQRILDNRLYRVMSRSFGAAHAYVAMERLHDVLGAGYDLVVLDTPPTRNALDILDAPNRLATFLEEGVVKWFVRDPGVGLRGRLLARGGAAATVVLPTPPGPTHTSSDLRCSRSSRLTPAPVCPIGQVMAGPRGC